MQGEGKIPGSGEEELLTWQPEASLPEPDVNEVRFSLGFLRAQPGKWFDSLASHWLPLFHGLGVEVRGVQVSTGFDFPEDLSRVTPMEVDGEIGVIGMDSRSESIIVQAVAPGATETASDIVVEYIERRLISTLVKSWSGEGNFTCYYISPDKAESAEVLGVIKASVQLSIGMVTVWFGIGPRLLERLDIQWREQIAAMQGRQASNALSDELHTITVNIAELAVPPAMLIDYMRSGTVIDLGVPVSQIVSLKLDGEPWAQGKLFRFNGRFAVQIGSLTPVRQQAPDSTTRVQIEIARAVLDKQGVVEHSQVGAFLLTSTPLSSTALLSISGENVANGLVGEIDGQFALSVLPK